MFFIHRSVHMTTALKAGWKPALRADHARLNFSRRNRVSASLPA
jgi:hypothetical protein